MIRQSKSQQNTGCPDSESGELTTRCSEVLLTVLIMLYAVTSWPQVWTVSAMELLSKAPLRPDLA
ncbi:uncharacterized protein BDV14DRAFT_161952 [Aspergillus stella-maris]|uniref:uncharacterized protein n=1 Tax=Aspergillus stella-maris TaxID=1810926 RepID=UPI003CCD15D7